MNINYPPYKQYASKPLDSKGKVSAYITFIDDKILSSLGLDRISYTNAKSTMMLGGKFIGNQEITSFDEFKYWGVKSISGDNEFRGCTNLESITLPPTVTYISSTAFNDCPNLKTIIIPNPDVVIDPEAFEGSPNVSIITNSIGIGFYAIGSTFIIGRLIPRQGLSRMRVGIDFIVN